jgi:hypothetical protein
MFSAVVVPGGRAAPGDARAVRTSLGRGAWPAVLVCGACENWLAVGHRPGDPDVADILLACSACRSVNDPGAATPVTVQVAGDPPGELARSEVWAKSVVERVLALAAQERRWPWRADAG